MNNSYTQIKTVIERIQPLILNQRIMKVRSLCSTTFSFQLSSSIKQNLIISLEQNSPFIDVTSSEVDFDLPYTHFQNSLKQFVNRSIIDQIDIVTNDRIVVLTFHRFSEAYKELNFKLWLELIPNHPNMIITDNLNTILLIFKPSGLDSKRPLLLGMTYVCPPTSINTDLQINETETTSINWESFLFSLKQTYLNEKYKQIIDYLYRREKILSRKIAKFEIEKNSHTKNLETKNIGNLLLTYQFSLKLEPELEIEGQKIKMDTAKTIIENSNQYFKIYHKSQAALVAIARESKLAKAEFDKLQSIINQIPVLNESDFLRLGNSLKIDSFLPLEKQTKSKPVSPNQPFHLSFHGTKLSFGKNRFQNDFLTFSFAKPNEWFFHTKDSSGAHVILHHEVPTNTQLEIASQLALCLSHQEGGEVVYAQVKTLKKGGKPGLVITSNYKSYRVVAIDQEIKDAIIQAQRY